MIYDMLYSIHLYDRYDKYDFFLFHFIFELLSIFMVMINIVKIEFINATKNYLLHIFSVRIFLLTELFLIHPIPIQSRPRGLDVTWTMMLYSTMSNNKINNSVERIRIESCFINNKLQLEKSWQFSFWLKSFHGVRLLMHGK